MNKAILITGVLLISMSTAVTTVSAQVQPWSVRMADSEMRRNPKPTTLDFSSAARWNYTQGLILKGVEAVWERGHEEKYIAYVREYYDLMVDAQGNIQQYSADELSLDRINPGKLFFPLYRLTHDEKYRKAAVLLRGQLNRQPRTADGGFWHKKIYPSQMWLDGIYMASPFLAEFGKTFNEPAAFDEVAKQILLMEKHARDEQTGLLYHGWDDSRQQKWCDPQTGRSKIFWGRAIGWYAMALVDILDYLPPDFKQRPEILATLNRLAEAIVKYQDGATGVWYQVVDQGARPRNYLESSASTMFAYALLKGAKKHYIDEKYLAAGRKAYQGILKQFIAVEQSGEVHIKLGCSVAGLGGNPYRDGSYEYYVGEPVRSDDPKAVGPFILASLELEELDAAAARSAAPGTPGTSLSVRWRDCMRQQPEWYKSADAVRIADNVLLFQRASGGWPKNLEMAAVLSEEDLAELRRRHTENDATIDNDATYTQMAYLALVHAATRQQRYEAPFLKGLDYLLAAQYPNGGWPQFYPQPADYHRHITFNDNAMIGVMSLLRDITPGHAQYAFVDDARRAKAAAAVARGVECILKCQVVVDGRRTAWCAQHDEITLAPAPARTYEKVSLSGRESVGIVRFLMDIENPSPEIVEAVQSAVAWLEKVRISGIREMSKEDPNLPGGRDKIVIADPAAPPLWARFYEIGSNRPIFSGRDGIVKERLADIEHERRVGYAWYVNDPARLLSRDYPAWSARRLARGVQKSLPVSADTHP